jgi:membrane fusion protein (multidrug efflux system)
MNKRLAVRAASTWTILILALVQAGCGDAQPHSSAQNKPKVSVVTLKAAPVALTTELPGRTVAVRTAQVRPQVNGLIDKRLFIEGSEVEAGKQLYQIDPALYEAELSTARAALTRAQAQAKSAAALARRYKSLVDSHAVSAQAYEDAIAANAQAQAEIMSAEAALQTAQINLNYTKVSSPLAGLIGRSAVTEGALVTANQPDPLAVIQQIDPIYVDVAQSSVQLLRLQQELGIGRLQTATDPAGAKITLTLEDGSSYQHQGVLKFSEVTVDPGTGSVVLRAEFPNPERRLLPGMFVRATLASGVFDRGLLVPQRGVTRNQRGLPTALVVNAEGRVELRQIKTDRTMGDQWLVTEGLHQGDRVIVEGVQAAHPGTDVEVIDSAGAAPDKPQSQPATAAQVQ